MHRMNKAALLALLGGCAAAALAGTAQAQTAAPGGLEEIIVTGSRIRTNPVDTAAPIQTLDRDKLLQTGLPNVGDILQRLPSSGGGLNGKFNSSGNFGFPPDGGGVGAGASEIDLRYLGSRRTLVLVDGQRWVQGSSASGVPSATDLNTIPSSIIERVEVLQDGASAIYGSDAIAGVVNIITRKDFEGFEANAYGSGYVDHGDGWQQQYDLSWGNKSEKLTTFLNLSYTKQNSVGAGDRDISDFPVPGLDECIATCSSATPRGRFIVTDPNTQQTFSITLAEAFAGGRRPVYNPAAPGSGDFEPFTTADRFNFQPFNYIMTPQERIGMYGQIQYDLLDNVRLNVKTLYNNRKSVNQAAPEPLFLGPEAGTGTITDTIGVHVTNPFNPFGFSLDPNDPATSTYAIFRRPIEAGPRIFKQDVDTYYLSGGFSGDFGVADRTWYWDTNVAYSKNRALQTKFNGFNAAKLKRALGPLAACQAEPGCVPFNLFGGPGSITPEMLNYVTYIQHDTSEQKLVDATANITGDLFDLPAGPVGFATGVEFRKHEGFFQPDAVVTAGETADVPATPVSGEFDVRELYGELSVPLLANLPMVESLDINGAVRVSDYSTFGTDETYKAGLQYRPTSDILLRGNYGEGVRAPGIGELFGSGSRFDDQLRDPCSDMRGLFGGQPASAAIQANCTALGVPASGTYEQLNPQISIVTGGNRDLKPETSTTWTAGFAYTPEWVADSGMGRRLDVSFDYFWIDLKDAIQAVNAQVQLSRCVETLDPVLCAGISRLPSGVINGFNNRLTNIGGIKTEGFDVAANYVSNETAAGTFSGNVVFSYLTKYDEIIPTSTGFDAVPRAGTERGSPPQAFPDFKINATLGWLFQDFSASWTVRYIDKVVEACDHDTTGLCSRPNQADLTNSENVLGTTVYNDVQVTWRPAMWDEKFYVTLGVNNLFDEDPPNCYSCQLNGMDQSTYDIPGMFGYARIGFKL
ncbi:MAG TPA: TonB-dependent receptor [Azospirillaceae bacterium]|nr:TonB-dependent receptor [Azospirillaceae bacterium]